MICFSKRTQVKKNMSHNTTSLRYNYESINYEILFLILYIYFSIAYSNERE